jgi:hypothetical protein
MGCDGIRGACCCCCCCTRLHCCSQATRCCCTRRLQDGAAREQWASCHTPWPRWREGGAAAAGGATAGGKSCCGTSGPMIKSRAAVHLAATLFSLLLRVCCFSPKYLCAKQLPLCQLADCCKRQHEVPECVSCTLHQSIPPNATRQVRASSALQQMSPQHSPGNMESFSTVAHTLLLGDEGCDMEHGSAVCT